MSGFDSVLLGDALDLGVFEEEGGADGVVSKRRVGRDVANSSATKKMSEIPNLDNLAVVHELPHEAEISEDSHVVLGVVSNELGLLEEGVTLDLVDGGRDAGRLGDGVNVLGVKVGDTDALDLLGVEELDHGLPGVDDRGLGVDLAFVVLLGEQVLREVTLGNERNGPVNLRRRSVG